MIMRDASCPFGAQLVVISVFGIKAALCDDTANALFWTLRPTVSAFGGSSVPKMLSSV
jgi:hypothetical protein